MQYPKVLIISEFGFNSNSGTGLLFRNLFDSYPKNRIGIIHEDITFHDSTLGLSICLKNKNKLLNFLIKSIPNKIKFFFKPFVFSLKKQIKKNKYSETNKYHKEYIKKFKPDLIYTILGNKELMHYIKDIHEHFSLPSIIHIMDNWVGQISKKEIEKKTLLEYFINSADIRIAINDKMAEVYEIKFKKKFHVIHNCLDRKKVKRVNNSNHTKVIRYIGSVFENAQLDSLIRISESVIILNNEKKNILFEIYLPKHQLKLHKPKFPKHYSVKVKLNKFDDNEYFSLISKTNVLILASNFDSKSINYYKYSWPAKMPSYLMSNVPIFILGPTEIFFISEAKKKKWGYVCKENGIKNIKKSILKILNDDNLKKELIKNAIKESQKFEQNLMKKKFHKILTHLNNQIVK